MRPDADEFAEGHLTEGARRRLRQIADVLGCGIADFYRGGAAPPDLAGALELLTLWEAITDAAGRARVLDCARAAAIREDRPAAAG